METVDGDGVDHVDVIDDIEEAEQYAERDECFNDQGDDRSTGES